MEQWYRQWKLAQAGRSHFNLLQQPERCSPLVSWRRVYDHVHQAGHLALVDCALGQPFV
jgi:hypothetical protein